MDDTADVYTYHRPAVINRYVKQKEFIDCPKRYTIVEATTKAGKTTGCLVWIFESALRGRYGHNFWWVAPVFSQSKIAFRRLKRFITNKDIFTANETELSITLANGAVIWFKSAEKPDNLFGEDVYGVVIDEATRMREEAWFAIRSTLTATNGPVKIIGNVKGTSNWAYRLARDAEKGKENWGYFKITAADAVAAKILDQAEIEDAEATLPRGVFLELYYGIPNENASDRFCYSFMKDKHVGRCSLNMEHTIYASFDFNYNPICVSLIQFYNNTIWVPKVLKLENSNIYSLCQAIKSTIPRFDDQLHMMLVTGDATGSSHSALVKDNLNYYRIIRQELGLGASQFKVPSINPKLEENQVLVNAILEHCNVQMDPDGASKLIYDCDYVKIGIDKKIIKTDRDDPMQQADALDTFRYYLNRFHKDFLKTRAL